MNSNYEQNTLGCLLLILGLIIPGLELVSNAFKALAYNQSQFSAFIFMLGGAIYILAALPILIIPGYLVSNQTRFLKVLPILVAFLLLLWNKFSSNEGSENAFLAISEIVPGLGKRFLLLSALLLDPQTSSLARIAHPFLPPLNNNRDDLKKKRD